MGLTFQELWDESQAFRQLFIHNGIFKSANEIDLAKAEVAWWSRFPKVEWGLCGHDGCGRFVAQGDSCEKHAMEGSLQKWKWHSGVLYRLMSIPYFVGDKGNNGGKVKEYVAYHLHVAKRVLGEVPDGYSVFYADANPFNLRDDNIVILSNVMLAAVRAEVVSVGTAMDMDDVLGDIIAERCGKGRPKSQWVYTLSSISKAARTSYKQVENDIRRGNLEPDSLESIANFVHSKRGVCGETLSKLREIG